jgi:hypothetical protein
LSDGKRPSCSKRNAVAVLNGAFAAATASVFLNFM